MRLDMEKIGGGTVNRTFSAGGVQMKRGDNLSVEFLKAIPTANRNVLIDKDFIQVWPKAATVSPPVAGVVRTAERHVVALGFGRYNVIEGDIINDGSLTKQEAYALAGKPLPTTNGNGEK